MECVRVCFLFLLFAWVGCNNTEKPEDTNNYFLDGRVVASIREYPSRLHKCTGTFIRRNILITTARCLICESNCYLIAHVLSEHLTDEGQSDPGASYNVIETAVHPNYQRDPQMNDVGLVKLEQDVDMAPVFNIPTEIFDMSDFPVNNYLWEFTGDVRDYTAVRKSGKTISSALCSLILEKYIDYRHICVRPSQYMPFGPFDQGTPLVMDFIGSGILIGIYTTEGRTHKRGVVVYDSLFPYLRWIHGTIDCDFKCNVYNELIHPIIPPLLDDGENRPYSDEKHHKHPSDKHPKPFHPTEPPEERETTHTPQPTRHPHSWTKNSTAPKNYHTGRPTKSPVVTEPTVPNRISGNMGPPRQNNPQKLLPRKANLFGKMN